MKSKVFSIVLLILSLPILLFVYSPSWKLGGLGLFLGVIGMTVSPVILFGVLLRYVYESWKK